MITHRNAATQATILLTDGFILPSGDQIPAGEVNALTGMTPSELWAIGIETITHVKPNLIDTKKHGGFTDSGTGADIVRTYAMIDKTPADLAADAEIARTVEVDETIRIDTVVNLIKAMTNAEYDVWWAANVDSPAKAIQVLKRVVRIIARNKI